MEKEMSFLVPVLAREIAKAAKAEAKNKAARAATKGQEDE